MTSFRALPAGLLAAAFAMIATAQPNAVPAARALPNTQSGGMPPAAQRAAGGDPACSVHLWDGKNYTDSDIVVGGPGRFANLKDLPGANGKDWSDEADSLKVGARATVKAWKHKDFKGAARTYAAGSEHPRLDDEPESLQISCQ